MIDKCERTKRMVIIVYVLLVGGIMFAINQTDMSSLNEIAFFRFALFCWGWGFAFHYFSALLQFQVDERNFCYWRMLGCRLLIAAATIVTTIALTYAAAQLVIYLKISLGIYYLVALAILLAGLWCSFMHAETFHAEMEPLKAT